MLRSNANDEGSAMTPELPTPDQQRTTANRYGGQRARRVYEPTEIPRATEPAPAPPTRANGAWKHTLWRWLVRTTVISVLAFVVGIVVTLVNTDQQSGTPHSQFVNMVSGVLIAPVFVVAFTAARRQPQRGRRFEKSRRKARRASSSSVGTGGFSLWVEQG